MTLLEISERPSPNHDPRDEPMRIDMLVLHYPVPLARRVV